MYIQSLNFGMRNKDSNGNSATLSKWLSPQACLLTCKIQILVTPTLMGSWKVPGSLVIIYHVTQVIIHPKLAPPKQDGKTWIGCHNNGYKTWGIIPSRAWNLLSWISIYYASLKGEPIWSKIGSVWSPEVESGLETWGCWKVFSWKGICSLDVKHMVHWEPQENTSHAQLPSLVC